MPARIRTRTGSPVTGEGSWGGSPLIITKNAKLERCEDVTGNFGGNNPFTAIKHEIGGCLMSTGSQGGTLYLNKCPSAFYDMNWVPIIPGFSPGALANRLLAGTGPLTPKISLPLFIYELKDIPAMLRHAGNLLGGFKRPSGLDPVKEAAAANLAWKFGWEPIISDLGKLLDVAESTRSIQRNLKKANSQRGLRRRLSLGTDSRVWEYDILHNSTFGFRPRSKASGYCTAETWGTVRWVVRDHTKYGKEPSFTESFRTAMGLNPGMLPIYVWKALPWSWMIDWYTDISNILIANYNTIYYKPSRACIMRKTTGTLTASPAYDAQGNLQVTEGRYSTTVKQRWSVPANTNFTLRAPMWDSYKLSVLGSLAILNQKRR